MKVKIKVNFDELRSLVNYIVDDLRHMSPTLQKIAQYQEDSTLRNFELQRSPSSGLPWADLKPATWRRKHGTMLVESGAMRAATIVRITGQFTASIENKQPYSGYVQAKREFLGFSDEDIAAISAIVERDLEAILERF